MGGSLRASMVSLNSQADLDIRQVFTQVGQYKGQIVAIKSINKKYIDLTRNVQKEMKVVSRFVVKVKVEMEVTIKMKLEVKLKVKVKVVSKFVVSKFVMKVKVKLEVKVKVKLMGS